MPSYEQCLWHIDAQTFCGEVLPTFADMLAHIEQVHNCKLQENIDFCSQQIFQSKMEMLEHFLSHIVSSEGTQMGLEAHYALDADVSLASFYETMKNERQKLMSRILCLPDAEEEEAEKMMFEEDFDQSL